MLAVCVKLDCAVVILLESIFDSCLESPCESEVDWEIEKSIPTLTADVGRCVFRSVVYDNVVVGRVILDDVVDDTLDVFRFIVGWD